MHLVPSGLQDAKQRPPAADVLQRLEGMLEQRGWGLSDA